MKKQRANVLAMFNTWNTRFSQCELNHMLKRPKEHMQRLLMGNGAYDDWSVVMGLLAMAQAIHDKRIVRDATSILESARLALNCCGHRGAADGEKWNAPTLTPDERDSIECLFALYKTQIEQLTYREYTNAFALAEARLRSVGTKVEVV